MASVGNAYLHGAPETPGATNDFQQLNAFFLLTDKPEVYNLPTAPSRAARRVALSDFDATMGGSAQATGSSVWHFGGGDGRFGLVISRASKR